MLCIYAEVSTSKMFSLKKLSRQGDFISAKKFVSICFSDAFSSLFFFFFFLNTLILLSVCLSIYILYPFNERTYIFSIWPIEIFENILRKGTFKTRFSHIFQNFLSLLLNLKSMGECNTILSAYTKYRHLG